MIDRILSDVTALHTRAVTAERDHEAACAELRLILAGLPYAEAKSGKNVKLRRRLTRFLGERIVGL